jgi:hypothetical protein
VSAIAPIIARTPTTPLKFANALHAVSPFHWRRAASVAAKNQKYAAPTQIH